nr:nucleotidyl transferase AbiEii/AbiGii toxin family protein [uncultured Sphaerochaeta sp.]
MKNNLALKGGTAINLTIFSLPRLSVDIDLDFTNNCSRAQMMDIRHDIIPEE